MSSGLAYAPPLYYFDNIIYDPEYFTNTNTGITQTYADATYLKRTGIAESTAIFTNFNGPVQCSNGLVISGGITIDTLTISGLATFNGSSTFNVPPTMSGVNISSNTIPALSIANNSLTQSQVSSGLQFVSLGTQNFGGSKTFNNPPIMSGANISSNTIPASSIADNSLTQTQVSSGLQFLNSTTQTITGEKQFNSNLPTSTLTPSTSTQLTTKSYVDANSGTILLSSANAWTNTNTFNSFLPTSTRTPTTSAQLTTKAYVDSVSGTALLLSANTWLNTNAFNTALPTSTLTPSSGTQLTTKTYVDANSGTALLSSANTWTNTNAFNSFLPTSSLTPSSGTQLTTKTYVDSAISSASLLSTANTWTNTNAFNSFLPTSSLTPTTSAQLTTKAYVDSISGTALLASANTWTNTNAFNSFLPTSSLTPSTSSQLTTKAYVDSAISSASLLSTANTWTNTNAFNTALPTSTLTPSTSTQLTTKAYVDSISGTALLASANTWTNTNAFNTFLPTSTITPSTSTQLTTKTYVDSSISSASLLPLNNIWTGTNRYDNAVTFKNALSVPDQTTQVSFNTNLNILGTTIGNFINWNQNGLSDSVSAGFDIFNQLNYDLYPFSTTSNITARIGTASNPFKEIILNGNVKISPGGQIAQPVGTIYNTGVTTTFTTLPPVILFDPKVGMGFVLPVPGPTTVGQIFIIRKVNAGSTVSFTVPGNLPVWVNLNASISSGLTALSISTIWQFTILSTLNAYITIA